MLLLNAIIADRIENEEEWKPSLEDFSRLEQEFHELRAVADGLFQDEVLEQLLRFDRLFISPQDRLFCARYGESGTPKQKAKADEIIEGAYAKIEPLWSFTVGLRGLLNRGENPLGARDAWWLGLIDEIIGTPTTRRKLSRTVKESLLRQMPFAEVAKLD